MFSRHHLRTGSHGVQVFSCKDSRKDLNTGRDEIFFKSSGNQNGIDRGRIRRPEGDIRCSGIGFDLGELFFIDDRDTSGVSISPFFELKNADSPICSGRRPSFISEIGTSSCLPEVDCPRPSYARGRTGNRHSRSGHTEQSGKLGGNTQIDRSRSLNHSLPMEFEWNQDKSDAGFAERGFDFAFVLHAFMDADRLIRKDTRWDYGEDRYQLMGAIEGRVCFLSHRPSVERLFGSFQHAKPTNERFSTMKTVRVKVDPISRSGLTEGRLDISRLDTTSERDIALQIAADDVEVMQDIARFTRRIRKRLGLTQLEFSHRIDVSLETIRNWEQGKRRPTGAAKALLKVLDKIPEAALSVLS